MASVMPTTNIWSVRLGPILSSNHPPKKQPGIPKINMMMPKIPSFHLCPNQNEGCVNAAERKHCVQTIVIEHSRDEVPHRFGRPGSSLSVVTVFAKEFDAPKRSVTHRLGI